jgi:uncharacterized protein (DUF1800 family)
MAIEAAIAANRFGIGARGDENIPDQPQKWLLDQLGRYDAKPALLAALPNRETISEDFKQYQMQRRETKQARDDKPLADGKPAPEMSPEMGKSGVKKGVGMANPARKEIRNHYADAVEARLNTALSSETGFAERLVHFWSNHFAVSAEKLPVVALAGNYEFEAIRPHIMGRFSDLLMAATHHPAMLVFLDQAQSIGPNSPAAQRVLERRDKKLGLNENLAREIMELHTLGVRTGYTQNDVTELARALTGLTGPDIKGVPIRQGPMRRRGLQGQAQVEAGFADARHEPGTRTVMGKSYAQGGSAQGMAILSDLAMHPATAKHIATKLAQHFVSDVPPPALVARLEQGFMKTGGDLPSLYRILIEAPESWAPTQAKFKTPWEWVVSSLRALNLRELPGNNSQGNPRVAALFTQMGQQVWKPGSPAGFADTQENWAGGAGLIRRVELASRFAQGRANQIDARILGPKILPGLFSEHTAQWIARAESPAQGLSLLLVAPEFLRR